MLATVLLVIIGCIAILSPWIILIGLAKAAYDGWKNQPEGGDPTIRELREDFKNKDFLGFTMNLLGLGWGILLIVWLILSALAIPLWLLWGD